MIHKKFEEIFALVRKEIDYLFYFQGNTEKEVPKMEDKTITPK